MSDRESEIRNDWMERFASVCLAMIVVSIWSLITFSIVGFCVYGIRELWRVW